MLKKRGALTIIFFLVLVSARADEIDSLVDQEKADTDRWMSEPGELPPVYRFGLPGSVEVYSTAADKGNSDNALCTGAEFDELIGLTRGNPEDPQTEVNLKLPRVREAMERMCLIRPGDSLTAVGWGWRKEVVVGDFSIRREKPACQDDQAYSLWGNLIEALPEAPVFFTTVPGLDASTFSFRLAGDLAAVSLDAPALKALGGQMKFLEDYEIHGFEAGFPNCDKLIKVERKHVNLEDSSLPNAGLYWQKGDEVGRIWEERVDAERGSGHIKIEGLLDFNSDGFIDLLISGDRFNCPYQILFLGQADGFEPVALPNKRCSC